MFSVTWVYELSVPGMHAGSDDVAVAVETVIDGVIDELIVPAPALEPAAVAVLHPADFVPREVDDLILRMAAEARPGHGVAEQVGQHVHTGGNRGRTGGMRARRRQNEKDEKSW